MVGNNGKVMSDPLSLLADRFRPAFTSVAGAPADPVVRASDRADAQVNGALAVAKATGKVPRDVATEVLELLGDVSDMCESTEVAGPGFINVVFSRAFLERELATMTRSSALGVSSIEGKETVVVDYSAPNVAKEMHVGHLRSTVIGDALVRMLNFVGYTTVRENHIGDWGTPFGMLIEHLIDFVWLHENISELSLPQEEARVYVGLIKDKEVVFERALELIHDEPLE